MAKRITHRKLKLISLLFSLLAFNLSAQVPYHARMNGGKIHYREGRYEKAKEQFEFALKERPEAAEANFWLGLTLAQLGEVSSAAFHLLKSFRLDTSFILITKREEDKRLIVWKTFLQYAQQLITQNQYESALPYAEKSIVIDEKRPIGYTVLAQLYSQLHKKSELYQLASDLIKRDSLAPQGYNTLGIYYFSSAVWDSAAFAYQKASNLYEIGIAEYREKIKRELKREDAEAAINKLLVLHQKRDVEEFRRYVEDSLRLPPKLRTLAQLVLELHNTILEKTQADARIGECYLQLSATSPSDSGKHRYLIVAESSFNAALTFDPTNLDARYRLGIVKYSLGEALKKKDKTAEAEVIFKELSTGLPLTKLSGSLQEKIRPLFEERGSQVFLLLPAAIAAEIKEGNFSYLYLLDTLTPFLSPFEPQFLENIYILLGACQVRIADWEKDLSRYDSAIKSFEKVILLNPKNLDAYQNLVVAYREKGNKKKAEELYIKMEEIKKERK